LKRQKVEVIKRIIFTNICMNKTARTTDFFIFTKSTQ
jgi:hypothetical protein